MSGQAVKLLHSAGPGFEAPWKGQSPHYTIRGKQMTLSYVTRRESCNFNTWDPALVPPAPSAHTRIFLSITLWLEEGELPEPGVLLCRNPPGCPAQPHKNQATVTLPGITEGGCRHTSKAVTELLAAAHSRKVCWQVQPGLLL